MSHINTLNINVNPQSRLIDRLKARMNGATAITPPFLPSLGGVPGVTRPGGRGGVSIRLQYAYAFGSRSKTGKDECSRAASAFAKRQATPADQKQLGECRAMARAGGQAKMQRAAGNELRAQRLEHLATGEHGPITAKARKAAVKERLKERIKKNAEREARQASEEPAKSVMTNEQTAQPTTSEQPRSREDIQGELKKKWLEHFDIVEKYKNGEIHDSDFTNQFHNKEMEISDLQKELAGLVSPKGEVQPPSGLSPREQAALHRAAKGSAEKRLSEIEQRGREIHGKPGISPERQEHVISNFRRAERAAQSQQPRHGATELAAYEQADAAWRAARAAHSANPTPETAAQVHETSGARIEALARAHNVGVGPPTESQERYEAEGKVEGGLTPKQQAAVRAGDVPSSVPSGVPGGVEGAKARLAERVSGKGETAPTTPTTPIASTAPVAPTAPEAKPKTPRKPRAKKGASASPVETPPAAQPMPTQPTPPSSIDDTIRDAISSVPRADNGMVPIHAVRDYVESKLGRAAAYGPDFKRAVFDLRSSGHRVIPISDYRDTNESQLNKSIQGTGNDFFYINPPDDTATFAARARAAAMRVPEDRLFLGDKAMIHHIHEEYTKSHGPIGLDEFKRRLIESQQAGHLNLSRIDMGGAANDPADVKRSEIRVEGGGPYTPGASFHALYLPERDPYAPKSASASALASASIPTAQPAAAPEMSPEMVARRARLERLGAGTDEAKGKLVGSRVMGVGGAKQRLAERRAARESARDVAPSVQPPAAQPVGSSEKLPYEMTREEYLAHHGASTRTEYESATVTHQDAIRDAIREGKSVPQRVLKDTGITVGEVRAQVRKEQKAAEDRRYYDALQVHLKAGYPIPEAKRRAAADVAKHSPSQTAQPPAAPVTQPPAAQSSGSAESGGSADHASRIRAAFPKLFRGQDPDERGLLVQNVAKAAGLTPDQAVAALAPHAANRDVEYDYASPEEQSRNKSFGIEMPSDPANGRAITAVRFFRPHKIGDASGASGTIGGGNKPITSPSQPAVPPPSPLGGVKGATSRLAERVKPPTTTTPKPPTAAPASTPTPAQRDVAGSTTTAHNSAVLNAIQAVPGNRPGQLVSFSEIRGKSGLSKPDFDRTILRLADQGILDLHHHDYAGSLNDEEKSRYVENPHMAARDPQRRFVVGVALRGGSGGQGGSQRSGYSRWYMADRTTQFST